MTEKTNKIVSYVRIWIYVTMFLAFGYLAIQNCYGLETKCVDTVEANDPEPESEDFWPPDMVPHPGIPGDGPKKNNDGDWA